MSGDRVVVVGDIINDIVVTPRAEIREDTDTPCTIRPRPGGSAANTAAWLGSLGVPVDFVGAVGVHDAPDHERWLRDQNVTPHLQVEYGLPTGTIVILVQDGKRTMLTERGANALLSVDGVTDELLASARVLHLSAYSFLDGFGLPGARTLVDRANEAGVLVAMNPGSVGYIADFGADRFLEATRGADVLFPNLAEGEMLTGTTGPERVLAALLELYPTVVLTMGAEGCVAATRGREPVALAAPRIRLVDPTGAGDAFAAGFLQRWLTTGDLRDAIAAATHVAARAIVAVGGRPAL